MRRLALLAAACVSLAAAPAAAQVFAIDQSVPLKLIGDDDETVSFVQIPGEGQAPANGSFDGWVWTFTRNVRGEGAARWNTAAVLTRFDCRAGTRQRMRYEFYIGEMAVSDSPYSEAPGAPNPGSIEAGALRTVCDPAYEPENPVLKGARGIRATVDAFFAQL